MKIMICYTLWTADRWLMRNSFALHGVFSELENAIAFAKKQRLWNNTNHVVINCGIIDQYESSEKRVFCTQNDTDSQKLA